MSYPFARPRASPTTYDLTPDLTASAPETPEAFSEEAPPSSFISRRGTGIGAAPAQKRKRGDDEADVCDYVSVKSRSEASILLSVRTDSGVQKFRCHQDIICRRAPKIQRAYSKKANEELSAEEELNVNYPSLPFHTRPEDIKLYLEWIYSPETNLLEDCVQKMRGRNVTTDTMIRDLATAWYVGDFIEDRVFQNDAMEALLRQQPASIDVGLVGDAWLELSGIAERSKLKEWVLDTAVHIMTPEDLEELHGEPGWCELISDILTTYSETIRSEERIRMPTYLDRKKYHVSDRQY